MRPTGPRRLEETMTKIAANSMKCASVNGSAHTAVVHIAHHEADPVEEGRQKPPTARSGAVKTKTESE